VPRQEFPAGFVWGAATAAYQVEGGFQADGRGESIWDRFARTPGRVRNGDTGDVACDHYHRYREDVALLAELGLDAYRFSVSWSRVLPDGTGAVNRAGLDFYDRLVDELLGKAIAPHLTLYHWDLPQALEDRGGWPVRSTAEAFAAYADIVARRLGDRLASIATLNEPWCAAYLGYGTGLHAPGRTDPAAAGAAAHHQLVAHGLAMQAIRAAAPRIPAGIVLNFEALEPASDRLLDLEASAIANEQLNAWFLDPIAGRAYPVAGGRSWDWRQEEILPGDPGLIATPIDFLGVNYYTRRRPQSPLLPAAEPPAQSPECTAMGWEVHPEGLTDVLLFVQSRTGDLPLYVTENGAAYELDPADPTCDPDRVSYLARHVAAAHRAIELGVPLRGYFAWSLLDNFEWHDGYAYRFGLVHVDFETLERRVRGSGRYWASLAAASRAADAAGATGGGR
jgi:beta-glucosidase